MRLASSAATLKVKAARSTSPRAAEIGLPASSAMVWARSSRRSRMPALMASSASDRFHTGMWRVVWNAAVACAMAASICSGPARCTTATRLPSKGLRTSSRSPVRTHCPAT